MKNRTAWLKNWGLVEIDGVLGFDVDGFRVIIDEEDVAEVCCRAWMLKHNPSGRGAPHVYEKRSGVALASIILGTPSGIVDHVNRDPLDNRRSNLRIATPSQNQANRTKDFARKGLTSQYKGVCWHRKDRKWHARIYQNNKAIHLGAFFNETDAARAYDAAALKIYGEFAVLNLAGTEASAVAEVA